MESQELSHGEIKKKNVNFCTPEHWDYITVVFYTNVKLLRGKIRKIQT